MQLDALLVGAAALGADDLDLLDRAAAAIEITAVVHDTRAVTPGALFCCVRGSHVDGHDLAPDAARAGAAALVVERPLELAVAQVRTRSVRDAMGPVAAAFWDAPSRAMHVVGVTGTSGKTTTTHLLAAIFEAHGWSAALVGTLSGARTTPEAPELQALLAAERAAGRDAVAMEVSSHALAMGRVRATRFAVAVFTNLSRDHLDFHADLDDYFETKASLFTPGYADAAVVNIDDPRGEELARRRLVPTDGYRLADAEALEVGSSSCRFRWRGAAVDLPLGGRFNVANALGAATAAARLGIPVDAIAAGLGQVPPVPGRWETIDEGQQFSVVVDYSHKPDALAQALATAREAAGATGRVLVVFGAGGDRDQSKRPEMGEVAARLADRVLLTSDNPRGEDPLLIIDAIRRGMATTAGLTVEPDRQAAIELAIDEARPGDVVLIAGKGHETYQVVGETKLDFDDRSVARAALARRQEVEPW